MKSSRRSSKAWPPARTAATQARASRARPPSRSSARSRRKERATALADAFKKAKVQAVEIAEAAGTTLGSLRQLTSVAQQGGGDSDSSGAEWQAYYRMMGAGRGAVPASESETDSEAQGTQPGEVTYRVTVTASFDVKE